jgi:hypothetical protein
MVKAGVLWGLFGGALENLGTERHHELYVRPLITLDLLGCFAMTETGHGSDVQGLETTATYDPDTEEYRRPESSRQLEEIYIDSPVQIWDDVRVVLFEDKNGLRAVEWEDHSNLGYFMLRRDLESAQPSK